MLKVKSLITKFLLSFFVLLIMLFSFAPTAHAQAAGEWFNQGFPEWYAKVYDTNNPSDIFGERYTAAQVQWVLYSIFSIPFNILGSKISSCLLSGNLEGCLPSMFSTSGPTPKIATPKNESLFAALTEDRPLSGITYFKNVARNWHLIPEANAQQVGFGFNTLDPILPLWRGFRNIAYAFLVIVALIFAFMIMFRVKISPQTVITVQSALPKLVIAIILVTFSYAIAGFLVDLMYVVIGLISLLFSSPAFLPFQTAIKPVWIFNLLTKGQPVGLDFGIGIWGLFILFLVIFVLAFAVIMIMSFGLLGDAVATIFAGIAFAASLATGTTILISLLGILIMFVVFIILLIHFLKILWMLLKAFANILLLTVFAPLQILIGTLVPNFGFGAWLKSFLSNLAIFPATGLLFLLSYIFVLRAMVMVIPSGGFGQNWVKAIFGTLLVDTVTSGSAYWPPLLVFGKSTSYVAALLMLMVGMVLFILIPKVGDMLQAFIQGKPFAFGTAIGEAVQPAGALYNAGPIRQFREQSSLRGGGALTRIIGELIGIQKGTIGGNIGTQIQDIGTGMEAKARGQH